MKKHVIFGIQLALLICCSTGIFAQSHPDKFSYSAIARDASGDPISNSAIGVQISVLEGSINGVVVYQENHTLNSDDFGRLSLQIGGGVVQVGALGLIDWSSNDFFLQVGLDAAGGSAYTEMGTSQLISVPYAMHAKTAASLSGGVHSVSATGDTLYLGADYVIIPGISSSNGGPGSQYSIPGAGVTDIEGNNYSTIVMNYGPEWMAENLRTGTYANGDPIPNVQDGTAWGNLTTGAWCHFENNPQYEPIYGKMYNWYAATDSRNACPTGWHLPSDSEMNALVANLGGEYVAGGKMKETGTDYWLAPNRDATNISGFSGRGGGARLSAVAGQFGLLQIAGCWWTTLAENSADAFAQACDFSDGAVGRGYDPKADGFQIRCVKD
ncbi:MAG: fibrobacter succinogenes major paralogous domain-containing protein [Flavobacteriales bacterium]|nr:fibrobacter succinogenes major paralogous domain-containing protein [Flavobacteriales bacterium]